MSGRDVFLRAAQWIDVGHRHMDGACIAVAVADGVESAEYMNFHYDRSAAAMKFVSVFRPIKANRDYWLDDCTCDPKQRRVIALLLAHAMRQTGDL